jgi:hypothetical protein
MYYMFAQKPQVPDTSDINYKKQLEYLYAQRSMIDALIESLKEYDRFRAQRLPDQNRQSA